ncbi:hypothetical protein POTOM_010175 [Populus tomentosa]|uniref:Uncharacterized protein n=1 Tax=Populus tomentosa TaxID=118781 RepID=A0A8X8DA43_POPTO|nr:hypothetical protein POTOM_010175 [Populus tomentosa]
MSLWFKLGLIILVVSTEMTAVHCRPLRSTNSTVIAAGCQQVDGTRGSMGMASFVVSSNNSSSRPSDSANFAFFEISKYLRLGIESEPNWWINITLQQKNAVTYHLKEPSKLAWFPNEAETYEFYNEFAKVMGFRVRKDKFRHEIDGTTRQG